MTCMIFEHRKTNPAVNAGKANFAKCARGACFLALKHAGFVLKAVV